jgi:8-amino-7-oxononanoate synthase
MFSAKQKPVLARCQTDPNTRLRLKYEPFYHVIDSENGVNITVDGRPMIMMSSNEYLGLSRHPKVIEAAQRALRQWGASPCGSRLANGSRSYHIELEEALAAFLGKPACHLTAAGYLACMSSLSCLAQRGDTLIVDIHMHASLWDGALLGGAHIERFDHQHLPALRELLAHLDPEQPTLIAVDGVCSIAGHIAPLPQLLELARPCRATLIVDDAHGIGVLGPNGRGTAEHFKLTGEVDLIAGSLSKAFGSTGGFVAGERAVIEYLRSNCRQIIFSAALGPAAAAAAHAALQIMQTEPEHRHRLWANTEYLRNILDALGLDYWNSPTPALPIVVGEKETLYRMWKSLWQDGFFTVMAFAPAVPPGKDLLRTAVTATHTTEQLDRFGDALRRAMKKAGLSPASRAG